MTKKSCPNGHKYTGEKCPYCPGGERQRRKTRVFGTTIRETVEAFKSVASSEKAQKISLRERNVILVRTVATLILAGVAVYFFIQGKQDVSCGLGGSIVGYWLK